jgi:hypothetical protein
MNRLQALRDAGVSIWLDTLSRELFESCSTASTPRSLGSARSATAPLHVPAPDRPTGGRLGVVGVACRSHPNPVEAA